MCLSLALALVHLLGGYCQALQSSKGVDGANTARAQRYASGLGVEVGIIDPDFYGILPLNHLGARLVAQFDFRGLTPPQPPVPLATIEDDHETLVADIIAGDDPIYMGAAPAAKIVNAAIDDLVVDSHRAASAWLATNRGTRLLNISAKFATNANAASAESLYWDWFAQTKYVLVVSAAGNTGGPLGVPADTFNGIAVGAMSDATHDRWSFSAYTLNGGAAGSEVRGKPDILAPGVDISDGLSFLNHPLSGTSFASPYVAGVAALVMDYSAHHPTTDAIDHRGIKAIVLNSARKRYSAAPEVLSTMSLDSAAPDATYDKDYLTCASSCSIANPSTAGLTQSWTPDAWTYDGSKLSVAKPLDDEQGVGFLDATRAIINLAGGNYSPGSVAGIGWDQRTITTVDSTSAHTYTIQQTLAAGSFLTATLSWDRIVSESDNDGIVEQPDTYAFGELANLDLRVLNAANQIVAESISTTDNVEHLHFPLPAGGQPGDYKLQVVYSGGGVLATDYALAWWADPTPLIPGDYNLDGTVSSLDYDLWRNNFGTSTATSPLVHGDGNGDGIIDAADYAIWRDHLGQIWANGLGTATNSRVPEPHTLVLLGTLSLMIASMRQRDS